MPQTNTEKQNTNIIVVSPAALTDIGYAADVSSEGCMHLTKNESNDRNSEKDSQLVYNVSTPDKSGEVSRQQKKDVENCDWPLVILPDYQVSKEVVYTSKASESSSTDTDRKNELPDELVNVKCKEIVTSERQIDLHVRNAQDFQRKIFRNTKCVNTINSGDHAYCQVIKDGHVEGTETNMNSRFASEIEKRDLECADDNLNVESSSSETLGDCNEKIDCLDEPEIDYPDNEKFFVLSKDPIVENNVQIYSLPVNNLYGKRKSHKSFMMSWNTQILCNGFAKCLIETCNFISVDNVIMREHYRSCDGVPNYNNNLCEFCNNWLISKDELIIHKYKCKKKIKGTTDSPCRVRNLEEIAGVSKSEIIIEDTSLEGSEPLKNLLDITAQEKLHNLSDEKLEHSVLNEEKLSENEDCSLPVEPNSQENRCTMEKKVLKNKHPNKIIEKISTEKFDDTCIVQPRRAIPKGQYVRRRGYTKLHKSSWEAALRKYKYVKCIYQNCHFLALSIKDMIYHFGYCDGDGSFAKFVCPYCVGRVTSGKILEIHIQRSHANRNCSASDNDNLNTVNESEFGSDDAKNEFSNNTYASSNEFITNSIGTTKNKKKCTKFAEEESSLSVTDRKIKTKVNISENERCSFSIDDNVYKKLLEESMEKNKSNREKNNDCSGDNTDTNNVDCLNLDVEESNSLGRKDNFIQIENSLLDNTKSLEYLPEINICRGIDNCDFVDFAGKNNPVDLNKELVKIVNDNSSTENIEDASVLNEKSSDMGVTDNSGKCALQKINYYLPSTQTRKVHKSFMTTWMDNIKKNGFARCLVATCNFISLDIYHIENHFKTCNGVFANGPNLCTLCNSRLPSAVELSIHNALCQANKGLDTVISAHSREVDKNLNETREAEFESTNKIEEQEQLDKHDNLINKKQLEFNEMDVIEKIGLTSENEDKASHFCPVDTTGPIDESEKKEKYLLYPHILKLKNNNTMDLNRIIQSGPVLSKGTYLRRRSYRKEHLRVWKLIFQKFNYIKCFFQNCHFLALSLQDMIYHFGCCSGDGSFAKFECPFCKGRVTTKEFLDIHINKSHAEMLNETSANDPAASECKLPSLKSNETDAESELLVSKLSVTAQKEIKTYGKRVKKPNVNNTDKINVKDESLISNDSSKCENWIFELRENLDKGSVEPNRDGEGCKNENDESISIWDDKKDHINTDKPDSVENLTLEILDYSLMEEYNKSPNQNEISNSSSKDDKLTYVENNYTFPSIFQYDENSVTRTNIESNESDRSKHRNSIGEACSDNFQGNNFVGEEAESVQTEHLVQAEVNTYKSFNNERHNDNNIEDETNGLDDGHVKTYNKNVDNCYEEKIDNEIEMLESFLEKVVAIDNNIGKVSRCSDDGTGTENIISMKISDVTDREKCESIKNGVCIENSETNSVFIQNGKEICNELEEPHKSSSENKELNEKLGKKRGRKRSRCNKEMVTSNENTKEQDSIHVKDFAGGSDGCLRRSVRRSVKKYNEKEEVNPSILIQDNTEVKKRRDSDEPNEKQIKMQSKNREQLNNSGGSRKRSRLSRDSINATGEVVEKSEEASNESNVEGTSTKKSKRGKKTGSKEDYQDNSEGSSEVKCAKCDFKAQKKKFSEHNFRKHVGLSWIEGEDPVDMNNEEQISWNIKQAFKLIKYAKCENCSDIKKSAMGFISHVQYCGKSTEEKEALKVKCPHCPSRILKYSLPMHLKLSHSDPVAESNKLGVMNASDGNDTAEVPTKRKSALKAANKVLEVLKECDDEEDPRKKLLYVFYKKGVSKFPKIPSKIRGLWKKMLNEKKKLPCRRGSCLFESSNIQEACNHHFLCNELPDKTFVCQVCDFFSSTRDAMQHHVNIHNTVDEDFAIDTEEEEIEEKSETLEEFELEDFSNVVEKKARLSDSVDENSLEAALKMEFFIRESLCKEKGDMFFKRSLRMTLERELEEMKEEGCTWPQLHTTAHDWIGVSLENGAMNHFPSLEESMAFYVKSKNNKNDEIIWKKMKRFEGEILEGMPLIFTGGSILSMSWCKISCGRSAEKISRQYLAVSSCRRMDKFPEIHEKCDGSTGLIQIWDCGELKVLSDVQSAPQMTMGIIHDSGEVWDLSWFPVDTYKESEDETFLTRLGILGAACQDGTIKIWSVCCPSKLQNEYSSPFYKVEPSVILQLEDRQNEGCLRLSFGRTGIVVGGYNNGMVAVWSLKNISSPFCKKVGKSFVLKPHLSFQAHRTSVTALSICSNSDRYITTSGLDRYIKFWDLECPANPFENIQREVCFDNLWPRHWPVTISSFEDIVPCLGNSMIKSIRDAYGGKHRTSLSLDNTCWSLSFSDWINVLAGCNNVGEVKIRFMRNMFISNDKLDVRAVHLLSATNLKLLTEGSKEAMQKPKGCNKEKEKSKEDISVPRTYEEACQKFGLVLKEYNVDHDVNRAKNLVKSNKRESCQSLEEFPITSVNKVCWNPNFDSFSFLAIGYHSGFVRFRHLANRKIQEETLRFSKEAKKLISK